MVQRIASGLFCPSPEKPGERAFSQDLGQGSKMSGLVIQGKLESEELKPVLRKSVDQKSVPSVGLAPVVSQSELICESQQPLQDYQRKESNEYEQ